MQNPSRRCAGSLRRFAASLLTSIAVFPLAMLTSLPAMAWPSQARAAAKGEEGHLESSHGELPSDAEHQLKGKAKQIGA